MTSVTIKTSPPRPRSFGGVILGRPVSLAGQGEDAKLSNVMMDVDFGDFGCSLAENIPLEILDDLPLDEDIWMEVDLDRQIEELESLNATSGCPSTPPPAPRAPTPLSPQPHYSHYSESPPPSSPRSPTSSFKSPTTLSFSNRGKKPYSSPRHSPRRSPPSPIQIQMSSYDAVDALQITRVQRQRPHAAALLSPVCIRSPPAPTAVTKSTISPSSPLATLLLQESKSTKVRGASSRTRFERLIEQGKQYALDREATEKVLPSLPVEFSASPISYSFDQLHLNSPTSPTTRIRSIRRSTHRQSTQPSATQAARLFATQARELDQFFGATSLPSSPNLSSRISGFAGESSEEESNTGIAEEVESLLAQAAMTMRRTVPVDENLLPGQKLDSWDIHLESYAGGRGSSVKRLGVGCQNRDRLVARTNASIARQYDPMLEEMNHRRSIMDEHLSRRKSVAVVKRKLKRAMKAMV